MITNGTMYTNKSTIKLLSGYQVIPLNIWVAKKKKKIHMVRESR